MTRVPGHRRNSRDRVGIAIVQGRGGRPTKRWHRWQDKSREARGGRSAGTRAMIKDLAQCAPAHESLPDRASHCKYRQERTSRSERDDARR
jgi:hypothetical protein